MATTTHSTAAFIAILVFLSSSAASLRSTHIALPTASDESENYKLYCNSWRLSVEANNDVGWTTIPSACRGYVEEYMNGDQYLSDLDVVANLSLAYATTVTIGDDDKDVWLFDIDEVMLSNLEYYATVAEYGYLPFNETKWNEWVYEAKATAISSSLNLYNELRKLGFQVIILTGRDETERSITEQNLLSAGYHSWNRLIMRQKEDQGKKAIDYKPVQRLILDLLLFRIHGSSGDQWSDLLGLAQAKRSFKLPNPMYYIA